MEIKGYLFDIYSCRHDYIDLYIQLTSPNDALLDAELLGRFCGDDMQEDLPQQVISTNNVIVLIFFSDDSKTYEGFQGHYEFIDAGERFSHCNFVRIFLIILSKISNCKKELFTLFHLCKTFQSSLNVKTISKGLYNV
jgi:hypothetical protein